MSALSRTPDGDSRCLVHATMSADCPDCAAELERAMHGDSRTAHCSGRGEEWVTLAQALEHLPAYIPEHKLRHVEHHFEDRRVIFDHCGLHDFITEFPEPEDVSSSSPLPRTPDGDSKAAPSAPPVPFALEETGETWTGTIVCVLLAYAIPPVVLVAVLAAWLA